MRRSQLYVPANREKMLRKSAQLEADSIILDLEDSVPAEEKAAARELANRVLKECEWGPRELCVRINALDSDEAEHDISQFSRVEKVDAFVIPKSEDVNLLRNLHKRTGKSLIPLIETPRGLLSAADIARVEGVAALSYGVGDLALSMHGSVKAYESNVFVKVTVVVAARAAGVDPLDRVFFDVKDADGFRADAIEAKGLGYSGKQVIHPDQVLLANEVFNPSREELEWAEKVVDAYEQAASKGAGSLTVDGVLVDAVHYRLARGILSQKPQSDKAEM